MWNALGLIMLQNIQAIPCSHCWEKKAEGMRYRLHYLPIRMELLKDKWRMLFEMGRCLLLRPLTSFITHSSGSQEARKSECVWVVWTWWCSWLVYLLEITLHQQTATLPVVVLPSHCFSLPVVLGLNFIFKTGLQFDVSANVYWFKMSLKKKNTSS